MYCFKTEETLFEGAVPFYVNTSPTAQYSLSSTSVLPGKYYSTAGKVLQYCRESTTVLPRKY